MPVPAPPDPQQRSAGLAIPKAELFKVKRKLKISRPVTHRGQKIINGCCRSIMAGHIKRHALKKGFLPQKGLQRPY